MKTLDMEIAVASHFDYFRNIIVPNISQGMCLHECDLLIMSKNGYATEVEIKISAADLKKDLLKKHQHKSNRIKYLYFAIPKELFKYESLIPEEAGILVAEILNNGKIHLTKYRYATPKSKYKFSNEEIANMTRLGTMRIWSLKSKIAKMLKDTSK